jgi:PQQ-dependent dehydrogenase (s-GDH family)
MRKTILLFVTFFIFLAGRSQTCPGLGSINFQRWDNISGTSVSSLTSNSRYPNSPTNSGTMTLFEMPTNLGNNIGVRMYGYICPPTTGNYVFWIASDNSGELWLSTTINPANKVRIAYNTSSTNSRQWNKYTTQKSVSIALTAGNKYYIEALMKESSGPDNLSIGWAKPGQPTTAPSEVIPGSFLSVNNVTTVALPTTPGNLSASNITGTSFTLSWAASASAAGIAGYDIYRNGIKINTATMIGTSYSVTGCLPNSMYAMTVKAKDSSGSQSVASSTLNVATLAKTAASEVFTVRTVIANQRMPHDLVYGPDNNIWYTERFAGTVSFVNPATGSKRIVLSLGSKMVRVSGQDGLMGLALHPQFNQSSPYVYISYTYQSLSSTVRKIRIERYTFDFVSQTLGSPVTVLENIPGSNDHNSARLSIGPDLKLYYSAGDMGAGQFDNLNRTQNAQALHIYEGKILRLNTDTLPGGNWIPADNPFTNTGQPTAVYSLGHRNPQGLVWGNVNGTGILYSSEHGPYSDDEINIIEKGRNYGWPQVAGFCDGNYNGRNIGGFNVVNEQTNCTSLNAKEPMRSIFPSENPPTGGDNMAWPSMAPSGTDFYGSTAIPGWQNSLLVAMLKAGTITRYQLSNDGLAVISDTINYFRGLGRFRDVVVSADGLKIYVACDSSGATSGPTGNVTSTPANPGSILEFTFSPAAPIPFITQRAQHLPVNLTEDKSLDIYPNPANQFVVVYNYTTDTRKFSLYDLNGRLMLQQSLTQSTSRINTSNLTSGMYILKITDSKDINIRTEKIVIRH